MSSIDQQILTLIGESGSKASGITHALKGIGGGSMHNGILTIASQYLETGTKIGFKRGLAGGLVGGLAVGAAGIFGVYFLVKSIRKNKYHIQESQRILNILEKNLNDSECDDEIPTEYSEEDKDVTEEGGESYE